EHRGAQAAQARRRARLHVGVALRVPADALRDGRARAAEGLRPRLVRLQARAAMTLDDTHDPALESWVESAHAPGCEFPIQNLPLGMFKRKGRKEPPRGGVAIGDQILDLAALRIRTGPTLNGLAAMGRKAARKLRRELSRALSVKTMHKKRLQKQLVPIKQAELFLPKAIADYSDSYTAFTTPRISAGCCG